jgi:hypothetical protein
MTAPTLDDVRTWPATIPLADACAVLGFSRSWGYELVARRAFPCRVLTVSHRHRVITASLVRLLSEWETPGPEPPEPDVTAAMTGRTLAKGNGCEHRNSGQRRSA